MPKATIHLNDLPVFAGLPVQHVRFGNAMDVAVHVSAPIDGTKLPLICLPAHVRNMSDFSTFLAAERILLGADWPIVLIDLPGRGRAGWIKDVSRYTTQHEAFALTQVLSALAIDKAIFLGQGHGGQVVMALGALRRSAIAASILIDAGPLSDPRGIVRQRTNLTHIATSRNRDQALAAFRQVLATDYPGRDVAVLDRLAERSHHLPEHARPVPLFDPALIAQFKDIAADDEFEPQWGLFNTLDHLPMMLGRTQLSDRLRREVFEEMARRRPDAVTFTIPNQGSPALLDGSDETGAIADFVEFVQKRNG